MMKIENGDKVKIISRSGESSSHPIGTILTVVDADDINFYPPVSAPCCVDDQGELVWVMLKNLEKVLDEPSDQASTIDVIKTFTMNHKNLEISFEDGMIVMRDCDVRLNQPMDYRCDTIEQLEELMGAWEVICKFKMEVEE